MKSIFILCVNVDRHETCKAVCMSNSLCSTYSDVCIHACPIFMRRMLKNMAESNLQLLVFNRFLQTRYLYILKFLKDIFV